MQAVTRVKLEQASKVKMWMPTRLRNGEGRAGREETNGTCPVHRGSEHGMQGRRSAASGGGSGLAEVAYPNVARKGGGQLGSRKGPYDRRSRVMPVEERALASGALVKKERRGDWR